MTEKRLTAKPTGNTKRQPHVPDRSTSAHNQRVQSSHHHDRTQPQRRTAQQQRDGCGCSAEFKVLRRRHRPPARCTRTHTALIMATHPATWACVAAATGGKSHQTTSQCTTTTTHLEESVESSHAHVVVTLRKKMEPTSQWRHREGR